MPQQTGPPGPELHTLDHPSQNASHELDSLPRILPQTRSSIPRMLHKVDHPSQNSSYKLDHLSQNAPTNLITPHKLDRPSQNSP